MASFNPAQIRLARESRGYSQSQLAEKVSGLAQSNLSKMEKGFLPVTRVMMERIAVALEYPVSFFEKSTQQTPMGAFYYRKRASLTKKTLMVMEAKRDVIRLLVDQLLDSVEIPEYQIPPMRVTSTLSARDIARRIRNYLQLPMGPIIDPVVILENHGIIIYEMDFNTDKLMGFTIHTDKGQPIIFINSNMPNDRKRFTLAHELGHLVMHLPFPELDIDDKTIEFEADEFAGEFNMPITDAYRDLSQIRLSNLGQLKSYWKISKAAILKQAVSAHIISADRYKYFMIELSRMGERKREKGMVEWYAPSLLTQIVNTHINELKYSLEELASMLGVSVNDCKQLLCFPTHPKVRIMSYA